MKSNSRASTAAVCAPTVHIHAIDLDRTGREIAACYELLGADEIARVNRFLRYAHRQRWIIGRAFLRRTLAVHVGDSPAAIRFTTNENGKPSIDHALGTPCVHFNLSHSHERVVVAVTSFGPVGVDIELERDLPGWRDIAVRCFTEHELAYIDAADCGVRQQLFYRCWTRKEAVIKATGEGLSSDLGSIDVSLGRATALIDRPENSGSCWHLCDLRPNNKYVGAIAVRSPAAPTIEYH